MTASEWDAFTNSLAREVSEKKITTKKDIRELLSKKEYSKTSREFIKINSGGGKKTSHVNVADTVDRVHKKINSNQKEISNRLREIGNGSFEQSKSYIRTYTNNLRKRARTIADLEEYNKTVAEVRRMQKVINKIRRASDSELSAILEKSVLEVGDIQFKKAVRSSLGSQVKTIAITEKSRIVNGNFRKRHVDNASSDALFDIVLSPTHIVPCVCDKLANGSPYTKKNLPVIPKDSHGRCKCRYRLHR
jgi:hypothetical protein